MSFLIPFSSLPQEEQYRIRVNIEKIQQKIEQLKLINLCNHFINMEGCLKHIEKRLELQHINNIQEYVKKIKDTVLNPEEILMGIYSIEKKLQDDRRDRLFFLKEKWLTIFIEMNNQELIIVTSFKLEKGIDLIIDGRFEKIVKIL
jgi:hypothetical protein